MAKRKGVKKQGGLLLAIVVGGGVLVALVWLIVSGSFEPARSSSVNAGRVTPVSEIIPAPSISPIASPLKSNTVATPIVTSTPANNASATASAAEIIAASSRLTAIVNAPTRISSVAPPDYLADQTKIESALKSLPGINSGVVILPDGRTIGNKPELQVPSASVIKLWIAATAYEESKPGGRLNLTETYTIKQSDIASGTGILGENIGKVYSYEQLINTMLIFSDNSAANVLINKIGGLDRINAYIQANGYKQTVIQRLLGDVGNTRNNFTSSQDCATFMRRLLQGEIIDQTSSERILAALRSRRIEPRDAALNFFGPKLPASLNYLHISGTGTKIRNEVGFFDLKPSTPVIVVLLTSEVNSEDAAEDAIASAVLQITQAVKG